MTIYSREANQNSYPFKLPELPFDTSDFHAFSQETFNYHHGKHHKAYVDNLNKELESIADLQKEDLESLILSSTDKYPKIFNNAAQVWNHTFFWHSISPSGGNKPFGNIAQKIDQDFGSFDNFASEFTQAILTQFGSGWAWLGLKDKILQIFKTSNAQSIITNGIYPILVCDVWEHAYYIDYRNRRPDYAKIFIDHMINWDFAQKNLNYFMNM
ncbi:MAG: superoxide dismutase [Rickettsiaceae bacterium]